MPDRTPAERLIDELWPCPEPPRDLAARVLDTLAGRPPVSASQPAPPLPAPPIPPTGMATPVAARPSSRRVALAGALSAAAVALVAALWVGASDGPTAEGHQVASVRTTVTIAQRAAAAMEPGADLSWSVRKRRVRVQQRRGSVFYRVDGGGPFQVVTPAGEVEVTGTCFRVTLGGGPATLAALTTLVSVLEGSVKVGSGEHALTVKAGEAVRLSPGRPPERVPGEATTGTDDAAARQRAQAGDADRARRVQAELEARLRALEVEMAERLRGSEPPRRFSRPAALTLPPATGVRVHGDVDQVSLSLSPAAGAGPVVVEVARDAAFKRRIFSGPVRVGFVTVPAPGRGSLYWRRSGRSELIGHARFLPDRRRSVLDLRRPHNLVKEGAESTSVYFQGAAPALTLAFEPTAGAHVYRLRVYRAGDVSRPLVDKVVAGVGARTSHALDPAALTEGRYLWTVQAMDEQGAPVGAARENRLELVYDNALDALAISRPRPAQKVVGREVEVAGVAPLGARLFVNGKAAPLDEKGRFTLTVTGAPRTLVFRLLGKTGAESYWVRRVNTRS
jgi:hypothetical protein